MTKGKYYYENVMSVRRTLLRSRNNNFRDLLMKLGVCDVEYLRKFYKELKVE